jgi:hypothetical protein
MLTITTDHRQASQFSEFLRSSFGLRLDDVGRSVAVRRVPIFPGDRVAFISEPISKAGLKPRPGPAHGIGVRFKWPIDDRSQRPPITGTVGRCARDRCHSPASTGCQFVAGNVGCRSSRTIICEQPNRKNATFAAILVKRPSRSALIWPQTSARWPRSVIKTFEGVLQ